jgi:hypothetical protein
LLSEATDFKPVCSTRTKLLLALMSLAMSLAVWYHVHYTENSIDRAIHVHPVEEDHDVCDMPGPCWGENPPVDCECY